MRVTIAGFTITKICEDPCMDYFIEHEDGEGMGMTEEQMREMFDEYFKENF